MKRPDDEEPEESWSDEVILRERGYSEEYLAARRARAAAKLDAAFTS